MRSSVLGVFQASMVKVPWERCALDQLVPLGLLGHPGLLEHLGQLDQLEKLELLDQQDLKVKLSLCQTEKIHAQLYRTMENKKQKKKY